MADECRTIADGCRAEAKAGRVMADIRGRWRRCAGRARTSPRSLADMGGKIAEGWREWADRARKVAGHRRRGAKKPWGRERKSRTVAEQPAVNAGPAPPPAPTVVPTAPQNV